MRNLVWLLVPVVCATLLHSVVTQAYRTWVLSKLATELELSFARDSDTTFDERYHNFELFRQGTRRVVFNVMQRGMEVRCGDFSWSEFRYYTKQRLSFCLFRLPCELPAQRVLVRRESLLDDIIDLVADDIDIPRRAEFSERFHVSSDAPGFARQFVAPLTGLLLDAKPAPPGLDFEGGHLLMASNRDLWQPDEFRANLRLGTKLIEHARTWCAAK